MPSAIIICLAAMLSLYIAEAKMSVIYAHDKLSDIIAKQCLNEMFPKSKHTQIQESDEPCIFFCVLRKFGIMTTSGVINLDIYGQRVKLAQHALDVKNVINDLGSTCKDIAEATPHKQDVCKKAKTFNDCTHLYKIMLI